MEDFVSISFAVTACNEEIELERLLTQIGGLMQSNDELVIQLDVNATPEVKRIANLYIDKKLDKIITFPLNGHFANFKNNLLNHCTKEFVFFIDADELLSDTLALNLHQILLVNRDVESFWLPRKNTVSGLTAEHVQKWGWNVDEHQRVNYPDYQCRIIKRRHGILWNGKVHETIVGASTRVYSPINVDLELFHHKGIKRQELQNQFYLEI